MNETGLVIVRGVSVHRANIDPDGWRSMVAAVVSRILVAKRRVGIIFYLFCLLALVRGCDRCCQENRIVRRQAPFSLFTSQELFAEKVRIETMKQKKECMQTVVVILFVFVVVYSVVDNPFLVELP